MGQRRRQATKQTEIKTRSTLKSRRATPNAPFESRSRKKDICICKKMAQNNWRFSDNPLKGHWRHMPDDLSLQRGPTIVILPDGRRIRVPAMSKRSVHAPGEKHNADDGEDIMKSLQALLAGKHGGPKPAPGFHRRQRHRVGGPIGPLKGGPGRVAAEGRVEDMPRPLMEGGLISAEA